MEEVRLIDANALHKRIEMNLRASNPFTIEECCYKDALNSVDEAPAIDPESLRGHAKWVKDKELKFIIVDDKQQPRGTGNLLYPLQGQNFAKRFRQLGLELLPGLRVQDEG